MENIREIIGENLASLRKEAKLTQLELAEKFNYSDKAVSKWEKGDTIPDIETLYNLCQFYGVTIDYLTHQGSLNDKKEYVLKKHSIEAILKALKPSNISIGSNEVKRITNINSCIN